MHRILIPSLAVAIAIGGAVLAADLKSGLQPGDPAGPFNVKDITGPNKGTSLCYR